MWNVIKNRFNENPVAIVLLLVMIGLIALDLIVDILF